MFSYIESKMKLTQVSIETDEVIESDVQVIFFRYSNNGRFILSQLRNKNLCILNADNLNICANIEFNGEVKNIIFSPDDKYAVCIKSNIITLVDIESSRIIENIDFLDIIPEVLFTLDSTKLVIFTSTYVLVFNTSDFSQIKREVIEYETSCKDVKIVYNNNLDVTIIILLDHILIFDMKKFEVIERFNRPKILLDSSNLYLTDNMDIICGIDGGIHIFSINKHREIVKNRKLNDFNFCVENDTLIGINRTNVNIYDLKTFQLIRNKKIRFLYRFVSNNKYLISNEFCGVTVIYNIETFEPIKVLSSPETLKSLYQFRPNIIL